MSDEQDYSSLPLEERAIHKVWKVRLNAYEEMTALFTKSPNEQDPCFAQYAQVDLFKKIVTDSNVVAQETGINCLCTILQFGGGKVSLKLRGVIVPLCEKSFISARQGTRQKATEALALFIEETNTPDIVIEQILPFLTHKIPKVVTAATKSLTDILSQFGCKTCSPKQIIPLIPKLFGHADKNVRAEATNLTVEIYKWLGPTFEDMIFPDLKPVQQKDLKTVFESIQDKPQQVRFLKSQREAQSMNNNENDNDGDVNMADGDAVDSEANNEDNVMLDPYDMADAIDVLSLLPNDFFGRISAVKWSERKEVLEELLKSLNPVIKFEDSNLNELIRSLSKCVGKDANIQVVTIAANCIEKIAKGLRHLFEKYIPMVLPSILERTKEKKSTVADALFASLDALFASSSFSHVTEDITKFLSHKTPQVKIATAQFLTRCLQTTKVPPTKQEYEMFLPPAVKLLSDSQEPVRSAASEAIGTLMKITGERELNGYYEKVDEIRMAKVKEYFNNAVVVAKASQPKPKPSIKSKVNRPATQQQQQATRSSTVPPPTQNRLSQISRPSLALGNNRQSILKKPLSNSIPTKRVATSPLKNETKAPIVSRLSNIGRPLPSSTTLNSINSPPLVQNEIPNAEREELEMLRLEKQTWLKEKERFQWKINDTATREERLMKEISALQFKNESLIEEHTKDIINLKSKDTQLARLHSDLESARLKIEKYESNQNLNQNYVQEQASPVRSKYISPFEDPSSSSSLGSDLSLKVKRLSIDNRDKENDSPQLDFSKSKMEMDLDSNDDSWRRAAEVTSQLKARIEKMKARSRSNVSNFGSR